MVRVQNKHTARVCEIEPGAVGWVRESDLAGPLGRGGLLVAVAPEPPPPPPEDTNKVILLPPLEMPEPLEYHAPKRRKS